MPIPRPIPLLLLLLLAGCSGSKSHPPDADLRKALAAELPATVEITTLEAEHTAGGDGALSKFKANLAPKEDLFLPAQAPSGIVLIKKTNPQGEKYPIYGSIESHRTIDKWNLDEPRFEANKLQFGRPRSSFAKEALLEGSPEATKALAEREERARTAAVELAALQAKMDAETKAEAEKAKAKADELDRQFWAENKRKTDATKTTWSKGKKFTGTWNRDGKSFPMEAEVLECSEGGIFRIQLSDPSMPIYKRVFEGSLTFLPKTGGITASITAGDYHGPWPETHIRALYASHQAQMELGETGGTASFEYGHEGTAELKAK